MALREGQEEALGIRELASGVDGLYLSGWAPRPDWLLDRLAGSRMLAEMARQSVPLDLGKETFEVQPHGLGRYRFRLDHRFGVLGIASKDSALPPYRFQTRADALHGEGAFELVAWLDGLLVDHFGPRELKVSRLDLHADFEGFELRKHDDEAFVCRAVTERTFGVAGRWTGFSFGQRGAELYGRIYDKTEHLKTRPQDAYVPELWGRPVDGPPVTRVEVEFKAGALKEFGLTEPREVVAAAGALWTAFSTDWLTLRIPNPTDATRSRWELDPRWLAVQRARLGSDAVGLTRLRRASQQAELEKIRKGIVGFASSYGALVGEDDPTALCERLPKLIEDHCLITGRSFHERVAQKRRP